jgi:hypothetical protein
MKIALSAPGRRRDPWWDMDGRTVRRNRRARLVIEFVVTSLAIVFLAWAFAFRVGSVTAAGAGVNLDQFATLDKAWQNGNLNGNNAAYPEGGIVPFRLAVEGLSKGTHSIHINYDFTAGGHKAYDFLATWNAWAKPGSCATSGGGISSMCPSLPPASSFPFPSDPFVANGLPVPAAEAYSAVPRRLTIWGGTITAISKQVHSGSVNGNSTADILVTFTSSGSAVLLSWGGHLAQSAFWDTAGGGERDGAGQVSGAPWHMRTLKLDGSGNKNQDRSIQPSAIVGELPPFALAPPTPTPRPTPVSVPNPTPRPGPGDPGPADPGPGAPGEPAGGAPTPPPTATAGPTRSTAPDTALPSMGAVALGLGVLAFALSRRARGGSAQRTR